MAQQPSAGWQRLVVMAGLCVPLALCIAMAWPQDLVTHAFSSQASPMRVSSRMASTPRGEGVGAPVLMMPEAAVVADHHATEAGDEDVRDEAMQPADIEAQLEEMGTVVSTFATAVFPLVAAMLALMGGALMRYIIQPYTQHRDTEELGLMEMGATEVTPLSRRGVLAALGTLPMLAASPAFAAKSGGRIGGSGFSSFKAARPPAAAAPPVAGPTTVYVAPPAVAVSPYGYGMGMAPAMPGFGFSTGELLALSALELGEAFVREQRRQEQLRQQLEVQRKLGQDEAQIQALQQQLAMQEERMRDLEKTMMQRGVGAPAS